MTVLLSVLLSVLSVGLGCLLLYILLLVIAAMAVRPQKEYPDNSRFYRMLLHSSTKAALWLCGVRVTVVGEEKIPSTGRFYLVCNHRSKFDPLITWSVFSKYEIAFLSKEENFRVPIFGRLIRRCCFLPIDRENPRLAMKSILAAADRMKRDQVSMGVYPEGKRNPEGELLPFHNGVFKAAAKADVPIVVMVVDGTEKIAKNLPFRKSRVRISVSEVINAEDVRSMNGAELGERIRTDMKRELSYGRREICDNDLSSTV